MIFRATDATFLNAVANDPSVRPHLHGVGALDYAPIIANPNNLVLTGEHGGMVFVQVIPGCYEVHTQFLPEGRGAWGLEFVQQAGDWLFSRTNANEVFTRVPEGNIAAMALARASGMKPEETVVQNLGDGVSRVTIYSGRIQDWIKIAPQLPARGQAFHVKLHEKYDALHLDIKTHAEDAWHDRHVGAAVGMITGGQVVKGVLVFNRWAAMALAPPMRLVSLDPLILDINDCQIEVHGEDFDVIPKQEAELCRVV